MKKSYVCQLFGLCLIIPSISYSLILHQSYTHTITDDKTSWTPLQDNIFINQDTTFTLKTDKVVDWIFGPTKKGMFFETGENQQKSFWGHGELNLIFGTKLNKNENAGYIQASTGSTLSINLPLKAKMVSKGYLYDGIISANGNNARVFINNDLHLKGGKDASSNQKNFGDYYTMVLSSRNGGSFYINTSNGTNLGNPNTLTQIEGDIGIHNGSSGYISIQNPHSYLRSRILTEGTFGLNLYDQAQNNPKLYIRAGTTTINLFNTTKSNLTDIQLTRGTLNVNSYNSNFQIQISQRERDVGSLNGNFQNSHVTGTLELQGEAKLKLQNSTFGGRLFGGKIQVNLDNSTWYVTDGSWVSHITSSIPTHASVNLLYNEDGTRRTGGRKVLTIAEAGESDLTFAMLLEPTKGNGDQMYISLQKNKTKKYRLKLYFEPNSSFKITKPITVASSNNHQLTFESIPTENGLSIYQATLIKNGSNWSVVQIQRVEDSNSASLRTLNTLPFAQLKLYTNSLNKRLGDLKEYRYDDGVWARTSYAQQSAQRYSNLTPYKNQHFLFQGGYDHAFRLSVGQNFLGAAFEYGHSWVKGGFFNGEGNTVGLVLYNTFVTHQRFYIDTLFKYLYSAENLALNNIAIGTQAIDSHFVYGSAEIGYKFIFQHLFFLQPLIEAGIGYIPQHTYNIQDEAKWRYQLIAQDSSPIFLQTGAYAGVELRGNVKGDVRFGAFFEYDNNLGTQLVLKDANTTLNYKDLQNYRLAIEFGTNLHFGKQFRVYINSKSSFFGYVNTDYEINLGVRYMFGKHYTPYDGGYKGRSSEKIARNTIYDIDQNRAKAQKYLLTQEELDSQLNTQNTRSVTQVQNNTQADQRMQHLKQSSNWTNTQENEQNYQNRNISEIKNRDEGMIRRNKQKEFNRRYGG